MTSLADIGLEIVRARRAQGMSQGALGKILGVHQQQVARWEASGYRAASLERVAAAAQAVGLDLPTAQGLPLAAEAPAAYHASVASRLASDTAPVRDLGEIASRIRAHGTEWRDVYRFDRIGVFGSFASGTQTPNSDVDLLVETTDPGGFRFVSAASFAEEILGRKADLARHHLLKERLREQVLSEVVYVWTA